MIARTSGLFTSIRARGRASSISPLTALRFSGRLSPTYASSPSIRVLIIPSAICRLLGSGFDEHFERALAARIENLVAIRRFVERKGMADDRSRIDLAAFHELGEMRDIAADIGESGAEGEVLHERRHHRKADRRIADHA